MKMRLLLALAVSIAAGVALMRRQHTPAFPPAESGVWTPVPASEPAS